MKVGDLVWNHHNGSVRFGTIKNKRKKNRWAYFTVNWHADDAYEQDIQWRMKLGGVDHSLKEYRADLLKNISAERLERVVEEHTKEGENEKN